VPVLPSDPSAESSSGPSLGSISVLVERAQGGDSDARERLARRCVEALARFAHGRLPRGVRGRLDTEDLVQSTVMAAFERLDRFEARRHGSFLAYLRSIVLNLLRDEARRLSVRSPHEEPGTELADSAPSPLEIAIGRDLVTAYEQALLELSESSREAVVLRLEMGYSYEDIAEAVGNGSANAARMMVVRALARLAESMCAHRRQS
jgi:RNA polymerase sigma-70 factor (ECF subfamily)